MVRPRRANAVLLPHWSSTVAIRMPSCPLTDPVGADEEKDEERGCNIIPQDMFGGLENVGAMPSPGLSASPTNL